MEEKAKEHLGEKLFLNFQEADCLMEKQKEKRVLNLIMKRSDWHVLDLVFNQLGCWIIDATGKKRAVYDAIPMGFKEKLELFVVNDNTELDYDERRETRWGCLKCGYLLLRVEQLSCYDDIKVTITHYDYVKYEGVDWYSQPEEFLNIFNGTHEFFSLNYPQMICK